MNIWDKIKILGNIFASLFIPIILLVIGNNFTNTLKQEEVSQKYVELAIEILKERPENNPQTIRYWAVDIINHYSQVKMDDKTKQGLIENNIKAFINEIESLDYHSEHAKTLRDMADRGVGIFQTELITMFLYFSDSVAQGDSTICHQNIQLLNRQLLVISEDSELGITVVATKEKECSGDAEENALVISHKDAIKLGLQTGDSGKKVYVYAADRGSSFYPLPPPSKLSP